MLTSFNGSDAVCAFMSLNTTRFNETWTRENLTDNLRAAWDINASWAERILINPPVRQYHMAKCNEEYQIIQKARYVPIPGYISMIWSDIIVCGILAWISICFNISLIVVTFRHIKEHKVCNWLLAFDALCQLFTMSIFVVNIFGFMFGVSVIDFRICMITLMATVMGTYSTMMTIFLISLERMLATVAPMRLAPLQTLKIVHRGSVIAVCISLAFGFYMSCSTLLYVNFWNQFNYHYYGTLYCIIGTYIRAINSTKGYILLILALMNYAVIFAVLLWRYFSGVTSGEFIRRVLLAVFTLTLLVIVGWLVFACNLQINSFLYNSMLWVYRQFFGIEDKIAYDLSSFHNIFNTLLAMLYWLSIVASAGGAPILYFTSTDYQNAYHKMLSRATVATNQVAPLFIQRRNEHEHGITTEVARNTTVAA